MELLHDYKYIYAFNDYLNTRHVTSKLYFYTSVDTVNFL